MDLERKPGNLASAAMWDQSDGALFWKIGEGRTPMPAAKALISEDERWHVINYLRTLAPPESVPTPPLYAAPESHRKAVSAVIRAYEPVRAALAGKGDGAAASKAVPALADASAALNKLDAGTLPEAARSTWQEDAGALATAADALKNAGDDLTKLREAFGPVSAAAIRTIEQYGHAEAGPVFVFVETPGRSGEGLSWLQTDTKPQDPFGAGTAVDKQAPKKRLGGLRKS